MELNDFDYSLPEELIAQEPISCRDESRLLVVDRAAQSITHSVFKNLNNHLDPQTNLVVNDSKVVPARLLGSKDGSGGRVEVFLLKRERDDYHYQVMLRPLAKIKESHRLVFGDDFWCQLIDRENRIVQFNRPDVLEQAYHFGHMPLPPYIKRGDTARDQVQYQTVYAQHPGSVAAPTAGLHFTNELCGGLKKAGHVINHVTLHVGYGTFKPVEVEDLEQHPMHHEEYDISPDIWNLLQKSKEAGQKILAVGTTSCRTLESVALGAALRGSTDLFIRPGYDFKMIDQLITNFHLPKSTLLMLVYAFGGVALMKKAYQEAIKEKYRFYSYGDAMLIK